MIKILSLTLITQINSELNKLKKLRPLNHGEIKAIRKWFNVTYTYNSNAIEGNTLSLGETKMVIEDGLTIGGKTVREILEAKNHGKATELLFNIVDKKIDLNLELILKLHKELLFDIDQENAGVFRKIQVYISGSEEKLPTAKEVPNSMKSFFKWYEENKSKLHPSTLASLAHFKFVKIHPFVDGNGKIARLLLNLILLQNSYPVVIVPVILRSEYITSLKNGETAFCDFIYKIILQNIKDYISMVKN